MLETVLAWIGSLLGMAGNATWVAIAGVLLAFIIKKYSKPDLYNQIYQGIYGLIFSIFAGITIVLNKATLGLWDKYLEPVFELALTSLLKAVMDGNSRLAKSALADIRKFAYATPFSAISYASV